MIKKKRVPQDKAVALRYDSKTDAAPKVVAKGNGLVAQAIREAALKHGIPVKQDDDLVEMLSQIDIDKNIPVELYAAVAEVLSWIYRANSDMKNHAGI